MICNNKQILASDFAVTEWKTAKHDKPFVFYISGDGGMNDFSTNLCKEINESGYDVAALNAKSYFWNKKTPAETAKEIINYLQKQFIGRTNQEFVVVGYSFGADVMPFIVNNLTEATHEKLMSTVLLSPSTSTDFEIHWSDMFGSSKKRSMDVVAEINKLGAKKLAIICGDDEDEFPFKQVKIPNFKNAILPGGHHYDKDSNIVAKTIVGFFK